MISKRSSWRFRSVAVFMMIMGLGIAGIWANDIAANMFSNQEHFFQWRNQGGDLLGLHILAEYLTALALIIAGLGLFLGKAWALRFTYISLGALIYTSINSLAWSFASPERYTYAIPMLVGLLGSIASLLFLRKAS